jgi:hypothetical protein
VVSAVVDTVRNNAAHLAEDPRKVEKMGEETLPSGSAPVETPISEDLTDVGPDGLEVLTETEETEPQETEQEGEADVATDPCADPQEFAAPVIPPLPAEVMSLTPETVNRDILDSLAQSPPDLVPGAFLAGIGDLFYERRFFYFPEKTVRGQMVINGELRVFERVDRQLWRRTA